MPAGQIDINTFALDVSVYTRRIRARILYNHLAVSSTPKASIEALVNSGRAKAIVDHPNYNPRVVEWMTDSLNVQEVAPEAYVAEFLAALSNPRRLWDAAFKTHISDKCRHLLIALFFASQYGAAIEDLRKMFNALHQQLCRMHGVSSDLKDFEDSVKVLEGGFIRIAGVMVTFINPSLRDYLSEYLNDLGLLVECAPAAQTAWWASAIWRHGTRPLVDQRTAASLAQAFVSVAQLFPTWRVWKRSVEGRMERHSSIL